MKASHPVGGPKAKFLRSFGYDEESATLLEEALLVLARSNEVDEKIDTPFGTKFIVRGAMTTPSGKTIVLRTVWIIEQGGEVPRFVTAIPD